MLEDYDMAEINEDLDVVMSAVVAILREWMGRGREQIEKE